MVACVVPSFSLAHRLGQLGLEGCAYFLVHPLAFVWHCHMVLRLCGIATWRFMGGGHFPPYHCICVALPHGARVGHVPWC